MAKITCFEDLDIWQLARRFTKNIYLEFRNNRDYSFRDQIQRSSVSVMNNIAEGYERNMPNEFIRYLKIAKGSAGETKSMLYVSEDLEYLSVKRASELRNDVQEIMNKTGSLISYLESKKK
jgi:four helix bundle protein